MLARWAGGTQPPALFSVFSHELELFRSRPHMGCERAGPHLSLISLAAVLFQRGMQMLDQEATIEGLVQETNRSALKRALPNILFRKGANKNKRQAMAHSAQMRLQLYTAHGRHLDVSNHARRIFQLRRLEKGFGRGENMNRISQRPDEVLRRGADRCIVIND